METQQFICPGCGTGTISSTCPSCGLPVEPKCPDCGQASGDCACDDAGAQQAEESQQAEEAAEERPA